MYPSSAARPYTNPVDVDGTADIKLETKCLNKYSFLQFLDFWTYDENTGDPSKGDIEFWRRWAPTI